MLFFFLSRGQVLQLKQKKVHKCSPCYFSSPAEIPGSIELLEISLTYEGVQLKKNIEFLQLFCICLFHMNEAMFCYKRVRLLKVMHNTII